MMIVITIVKMNDNAYNYNRNNDDGNDNNDNNYCSYDIADHNIT